MSEELARYNSGKIVNFEDFAMKAEDLKRQVVLIQQLMKEIMKSGEHFGVIPGCGKKPSLLKPGAEKLSTAFRLAPSYEIKKTDLTGGHREYEILCTLTHITTGAIVGQGVGSCSTMEAKYRFRTGEVKSTGKPVPAKYWQDRDPELIGGKGFGVRKVDGKWEIVEAGEKAEHDNPADYYNTVLKMAKKRAHVDAVLTATAASDIFTQDIEDLPGVGNGDGEDPGNGKGEARTGGKSKPEKPKAAAGGKGEGKTQPPAPKPDQATREQYNALYAKGFASWPETEPDTVRRYVREIGGWHRKGAYLTKVEASELIERWDEMLDRYMAEKQMEAESAGEPREPGEERPAA